MLQLTNQTLLDLSDVKTTKLYLLFLLTCLSQVGGFSVLCSFHSGTEADRLSTMWNIAGHHGEVKGNITNSTLVLKAPFQKWHTELVLTSVGHGRLHSHG